MAGAHARMHAGTHAHREDQAASMQLVPTQARAKRPGSADVGGDLRLTSQPAPPPLPSAFPPAPTRADDRSREGGQRCRTLKCAATAAARPHDRTLSGMPAAHTITPQLAMRSSRRTNEPAEAGPIGRRAVARGRRGSGARGHGARSVRRPRSPSAAQPARRITRPSEATAGTRRSGAGTGAEYLRVRIDGTVRRRQNLDLAMTAPQRTPCGCVCVCVGVRARARACVRACVYMLCVRVCCGGADSRRRRCVRSVAWPAGSTPTLVRLAGLL